MNCSHRVWSCHSEHCHAFFSQPLSLTSFVRIPGMSLLPLSQAFTIYEEGVSDQRHRITALHSIVGTLHRCHVFGTENRDALVQNAAAYAARLLKRGDQCKAVCACSHLSWQVGECWCRGFLVGLFPI